MGNQRVEWVGGLVSMPGYVTGEGEPYRPELLVWLGPNGAVLGSEVAKPGEALGRAVESLRKTFDEPMYGRPHRPERLRVASAELAAALRAGQVEVDIVCGPTPELDEVSTALREHLQDDSVLSYLSPDVSSDAVSAFFEAAADLYRMKPWHVLPRAECPISVSIEALGLRNAALTVIGQLGESLGLVVHEDADAFDDYLDAADAFARGESVEPPSHFSLNFVRGAELQPSLRKEVYDRDAR